jgi:hypothetical protein
VSILSIKDLADSKELDHRAMDLVRGGLDATAGLVAGGIAAASTEAHAKSKANFQDMHFTHYYDKASPVL